jgi:hypothetical protein
MLSQAPHSAWLCGQVHAQPISGLDVGLHLSVEGACDDVLLLLGSELGEVHCIATHADGQVGVLLRVLQAASTEHSR